MDVKNGSDGILVLNTNLSKHQVLDPFNDDTRDPMSSYCTEGLCSEIIHCPMHFCSLCGVLDIQMAAAGELLFVSPNKFVSISVPGVFFSLVAIPSWVLCKLGLGLKKMHVDYFHNKAIADFSLRASSCLL